MRIGDLNTIGFANQIQRTQFAISKSLERLSSGTRNNSASDGAADLAEMTTLDAQIRGTNQAILNLNNGQSILQTAANAISSQQDILQKMRELTVQAASGTLTSYDRAGLNSQFQQLAQEFQSITQYTQFDGLKLLDGSFGTQSLQSGSSRNDNFQISIGNLNSSQVFTKSVGSGTFAAASTYSKLGSNIVDGDFNGDGKLDVASVNFTGIILEIGNGDGTFKTSSTTSVTASFTQVRAIDINNDGKLDLVGFGSSTMYTILGNGDGSFQSAKTAALDSISSNGFDAGDINGDGNKDILVSSGGGSAEMQVLLGNGDGTYKPVTTFSSSIPNNVILADVNRDGILDYLSDNGGNPLVVALGNGDGTFQAELSFGGGMGLLGTSLAVGDFNGDGKLDVASTSSSLAILLGNGDGTFQNPVTYDGSTRNLHIADINNDGIQDIIGTSAQGASIFIGNGNGTFKPTITYSSMASVAGGNLSASVVRDFNGDGVLDLFINGTSSNNYFQGIAINQYAGSSLNLSSQANAQTVIGIVDQAITYVQNQQSQIAALATRVDVSSDWKNTLLTTYQDAKSLLGDTDIATETAELTRNQILQQAQVAVLAQANVNLQVVLKLFEKL